MSKLLPAGNKATLDVFVLQYSLDFAFISIWQFSLATKWPPLLSVASSVSGNYFDIKVD